MSTIPELTPKIDRDHSRPTAFSRCICTHIAAQHTHANGWNLIGPCLRCDCKRLEVSS